MRQSILAVLFVFILLLSSVSFGEGQAAWSFIIVGDSRGGLLTGKGFNEPVVEDLAAEIVRKKVDFVVFPGDLVLGGDRRKLEKQLTAWRQAMEPVYAAGIGVYPVRGNHDVADRGGAEVWRNVFSGPYSLPQNGPAGEEGMTYAIKHRNMLVLGLDQYVNPHRVNQRWLDEQFAKNDRPHTLVFGHEPAFAVKHEDCLDDDRQARDAFWESLKRAGVRVYACGHDHFFDHAVVDDGDGDPSNDIHQYVVATAGAPPKDWSPPYKGANGNKTVTQQQHDKGSGYVLVQVLSDTDYRMTWHGLDKKTGQYVASAKSNPISSRPTAALAATIE